MSARTLYRRVEAGELMRRRDTEGRTQIGVPMPSVTDATSGVRHVTDDVTDATSGVRHVTDDVTDATSGVRHATDPDVARQTRDAEWRDDLLAQVAGLEANEDHLRADVDASGRREELSKARIVDLERAATVREARIADMEATHASDLSELRGQVANLEAELRDSHSRAEANALGWANRADELSHRIADLVDKHQQANERVYELEPVADQVPMLQAAVEEKDATLSDRERVLQLREHELGNMKDDIEAIANRPVAGPVFRLLTKGKLRV